MDALLRGLREGRTTADASAPVLMITDSLAAIGSQGMFLKNIPDLWAAMRNGRAQATRLVVLLADRPLEAFARMRAQNSASCTFECICMHHGPLPASGGHADGGPPGGHGAHQGAHSIAPVPQHGARSLTSVLHELCVPPAGMSHPPTAPAASTAVAIDSLSQLIDTHSFAAVLQFLHGLARSSTTSCIYTLLHEDTLAPHELFALESMAMCRASVRALEAGVREAGSMQGAQVPDGEVRFSFRKRMSGRLRVESMLYSLTGPHTAVLFKALEAPRAPDTPACGSHQIDKQMGAMKVSTQEPQVGGMRLELSSQEKAAKEKVVLPYQHQGAASLYRANDFLEYLPVAAGGRGGPGGSLGHVMYVRDSDEECDSDEDPDDDLDI